MNRYFKTIASLLLLVLFLAGGVISRDVVNTRLFVALAIIAGASALHFISTQNYLHDEISTEVEAH